MEFKNLIHISYLVNRISLRNKYIAKKEKLQVGVDLVSILRRTGVPRFHEGRPACLYKCRGSIYRTRQM